MLKYKIPQIVTLTQDFPFKIRIGNPVKTRTLIIN